MARVTGALLCLIVAGIHVIDQGGFPGDKGPDYVAIGYYVLEGVAILTAIALAADLARLGWFVAIGVALGPLVGYVLSRGPGLPGYTDDIGNWTEPLGLASLLVEAMLLVLASMMFVRSLRRAQPVTHVISAPQPPSF
ncbi:MAG: hypothetical protein JOZ47_00225 [Kutzneria sp.]|nr:hypothetical protein [Kutzneria sp.]MBV9843485.1 hypothetical protein [Kutzneria sp.]